MATFPLKIMTPDGVAFEGEVVRVVCRTITGDLAILARHSDYCTALGMGDAHIVLEDGTTRHAACMGGMLSMMNGECHLLATTFEWVEDIDRERAAQAQQKAEERLKTLERGDEQFAIAEAKLKRAIARLRATD